MYVFMYVYIWFYVYIYVCIYVRVCVYVCVYMYIYLVSSGLGVPIEDNIRIMSFYVTSYGLKCDDVSLGNMHGTYTINTLCHSPERILTQQIVFWRLTMLPRYKLIIFITRYSWHRLNGQSFLYCATCFNTKTLRIFPQSAFICSVWFLQLIMIISLNGIGRWVIIMEECVYWDGRKWVLQQRLKACDVHATNALHLNHN
jgi:hypothetical protein